MNKSYQHITIMVNGSIRLSINDVVDVGLEVIPWLSGVVDTKDGAMAKENGETNLVFNITAKVR